MQASKHHTPSFQSINAIILLVFACLQMSAVLKAQNLIFNYSFETASMCPENEDMLNIASYWNNPTNGTADYFVVCSQEACPANYQKISPSVCAIGNWWGSQMPRTGYRYAGFIAQRNRGTGTWTPNATSSVREYVQVLFPDALVAGEKYYIEFYVSLSELSVYTVPHIGAHLSSNKLGLTNAGNFECCEPQILNDTPVTDRDGWTKISGCYTATGGELFITIGNFDNDTETTVIDVPGGIDTGQEGAYFYIDDVSVIHMDVDLGPDQTICAESSISLDAYIDVRPTDIVVQYNWQDGTRQPQYSASLEGEYLVEVDINGCTARDSMEVFHLPVKQINLGPYEEICLGDSIRLDASNPNSTYVWQDGSTLSYYDVIRQGQYWVEVTDLCGPEKAYKEVGVSPYCDCEFYVPNAFTPNADGVNDFFVPVSECYFTDYHIQIFSRWGRLVFESTIPNFSWDGSYLGSPAPTGLYAYTIEYLSFGKNRTSTKGHIVLSR